MPSGFSGLHCLKELNAHLISPMFTTGFAECQIFLDVFLRSFSSEFFQESGVRLVVSGLGKCT